MKSSKTQMRGFTLIELIIVSVIVGIMTAVLSPLMLSSLRAHDDILGDVVALDKLRYATERLAREIREIQYASSTTTPATFCNPPTNTIIDQYCITAMGTSGLTFRRSYTDSTGVPTWRTVTIGSTSTAVTLAYSDINSGTAQVLTDELGAASNLVFHYFQKDDTTAATLAGNVNCAVLTTCVSFVQIGLTLSHNGQTYTQSTRVNLRNSIL